MSQGHCREIPSRMARRDRPSDQVNIFIIFHPEQTKVNILISTRAGKKVLIAAHGNSLRALIKYLDNVGDEEIVELNVPTGIPLVYELDAETLKPVKKSYYLADEATVKAAQSAVANQGKKKE